MGLPCDLLLGMSCGFTGSRHGITAFQRAALMDALTDAKPLEGHYGDCKGADYEFFMICKALGVRTVAHPGDNELWRMFTLADEVHPPKPNLVRNRDIVSGCDYLIACPGEAMMVTRSGTWATVRHAIPLRTVLVILPDGRVDISRVDLLGCVCCGRVHLAGCGEPGRNRYFQYAADACCFRLPGQGRPVRDPSSE